MLYLCATPIGNMGDITVRVIEALKDCDVVYCEDTRRAGQLLSYHGIRKPLVSCHEHNERARFEEVAQRLMQGENVVYISDAGMPAISDPGEVLVRGCIERGLEFTVLPGASAVLCAVALCGLGTGPFTFWGFLPRVGAERKAALASIAKLEHRVILYESPHRVQATLIELKDVLGDVDSAVLRELTKRFEEVKRGKLSELIDLYEEEPKGECVIAVLPKPAVQSAGEAELEKLLKLLLVHLSKKDSASIAAEMLGVSRNEAYRKALSLDE